MVLFIVVVFVVVFDVDLELPPPMVQRYSERQMIPVHTG